MLNILSHILITGGEEDAQRTSNVFSNMSYGRLFHNASANTDTFGRSQLLPVLSRVEDRNEFNSKQEQTTDNYF